ncbi:MAG TPA: AAA family ATPase [Gammaproteobacteria bacterium]|nr:AAA family ATPase [Gammaproteobacteria bacterium]
MIEFPPFRLDLANQCLWRRADRGEERLLLRPKAHAILRHLVERAGRLVTEAELLEAVWPRVHVHPEAVKTTLHEVRRALGDNAKAPIYIETLPKRGYRFIAPVRDDSVAAVVQPVRAAHARLVGRDRVLAQLRDSLLKAARGQRQMVLVAGEAGIGKSTVLEEFQRRALGEIPQLRIGLGQCIEGYGGKEAYFPVLDALSQLGRAESFSVVETLAVHAPTWLVQLPGLVKREHRETLQQEILGSTRDRMIREIGMALDMLASEEPLLLVLEDLQWVDRATVDFLSALARRRTPAKLLVVATYRTEDLESEDQPLAKVRQELLLHGLCRELDVTPLTEAEVAEYLAHGSSPVRAPEGLATLLWQRTGGNPLFIAAVLDDLAQRGLVARHDGGWQPAVPLPQLDFAVPDGLRQMIETQIRRLSDEERRALETASVVGETFFAGTVAAATGQLPEDCECLFERLARRRRVIAPTGTQYLPDGTTSQSYAFVGPLHREVLYRGQAPTRRAKAHGRIGEHLETLFSSRLDEAAPELAYHFESAADWPRAVAYLEMAAEDARSRLAQTEAAALLERAHRLAARLPEADRPAPEIRVRLGRAGDRAFPKLVTGAAH